MLTESRVLGRRRFLELLTAGVCFQRPPSARAQPATALPPVPRVNGAVNIQPLRLLEPGPPDARPLIDPQLVELQLRAVYALAFEQLRVTLPFNRISPDFLAAIPYVRAARALGVDVVGVMSDFAGYSLVQSLAQQRSFAAVLNTYRDIFVLPEVAPAPGIPRAGSFSLQVLNEPVHSLGLEPREYVQRFLRPVNAFFKLRSPELLIVSAAEVGNVGGIARVRAMLEAGLEAACDRVAYHVYSRRVVPLLAGLTQRPVWITESGAEGTANHLSWFRDGFAEIRSGIARVERIFYYALFDEQPGRFRLLDIMKDASGRFRARAESQALLEHLAARATEAAGARPTAAFEDLVPDVLAYFPTQADLDRIVEATPFLPPP